MNDYEIRGSFKTDHYDIFLCFRHVCRPFKNSEFGNFDNKLAVIR